mgnify:CR=1 FL=1
MTLNTNIRRYRTENGLSQEYVGEKLHMSQSTYSRLERLGHVSNALLLRIAETFGTTPEVLRTYHQNYPDNASDTPNLDSPSRPDDLVAVLKADLEDVKREMAQFRQQPKTLPEENDVG